MVLADTPTRAESVALKQTGKSEGNGPDLSYVYVVMWEIMVSTTERRARLTIDVPANTRRRVRLAAAKRDLSIRDYVIEVLDERLREDLGDEHAEVGDALTEQSDPVLGQLWHNAADAAYDDL